MAETTVIIDVKGFIVPDEDAFIYRWFGYAAVCPRDINDALKKAGGQPVTVRINSYGGVTWSASEIYTALRSYAGRVTVEVVGLAASGASVIMVAGNPVRASPTSEIMIHNSIGSAEGDYRVMDAASESLRNSRETIVNAYALKCNKRRTELRRLMNHETWMTAQRAQELGFVDEIMFAEAGALDEDDPSVAEATPPLSGEAEGGAGAGRQNAVMPSAAVLRAQKAVWDEIMPGARSVEQIRALLHGSEDEGAHQLGVEVTGCDPGPRVDELFAELILEGRADMESTPTEAVDDGRMISAPTEGRAEQNPAPTEAVGQEDEGQRELELLRARVIALGT